MKTILQTTIVLSVTALMFFGCAAPIKLLTPAQESLGQFQQLQITMPKNDVVGKIDSSLVRSIMNDAVERILDLKHFSHVIVDDSIKLKSEIESQIIRLSLTTDTLATAILKTTITEYDEGSAALRFFFAPFAGTGKVTLELAVINKQTNREILKAKSTANITGAFSSASSVVDPLSRAINNFVEKYFVKDTKK